MKISMKDLNQNIKSLDGSDHSIITSIDDDGKPVRKQLKIKDAICNSLLANYQDEKNVEGSEKANRYMLATKFYNGKEVELMAEDISLIKKLVGKNSSPLIVGNIYSLLDPSCLSALQTIDNSKQSKKKGKGK